MERYPNSSRRFAGSTLPVCAVSVAIGLLICILPAQATIFASPSNLDFGSLPYLSTSSSRYITVTNSGATEVSGSIEISGDFSDDGSGDCGSSLGPETSCMLGVVFMPNGVGVRNGSITLFGEQSVSLTGTGIDNQKPFVYLDAPLKVLFGADITLSAAKSFDMGGGTIASYTWTSLTGSGAIAKDTAIVTTVPSLYIPFTPDNPVPLGTQTFRLVVTDDSGNASDPVSATFSVIDNQKPLALPGINFINSSVVGVNWGESFTLNGGRSFDVGGGRVAAYRWKSLTATIPGMQLSQVVETVTPDLEIVLSQLAPVPAGRYSFELVVVDDSANLSDPATVDLQVTESWYPLQVNIAGNGSGTVHSSSTLVGSPQDISCPGACSASYHLNSPVSLTATPAWYSSLSWSGVDSFAGSGALVNLNSSRSVSAVFSQKPNARLLPDNSFGSLQLAYNAAAPSGGAIQAKNSALVAFTETLSCDQPYTVSINGGKNETFGPTSGYSLIQGELRISKGRVNVSGIKLRP